MDITSLSAFTRSKQRRPRRHTTEVRIEDLPKRNEEFMKDKTSTLPLSTTHLAPEHELHFEDSSSQEDNDQQMPMSGLAKTALTASWHSLEDSSDVEVVTSGSEYYQGSQADVLKEMAHPFPNHLEAPKHGYQLSYELALDNMLTPFASPSSPPYGRTPTTYTGHVIMEILTTERMYVGDLTDIVEGYIFPLESRVGDLQLGKEDIESLFGNVKEIKDFNRSVLHALKTCGDSSRKVGQCFLEKAEGFKTHYSRYCNNYPNSIQVLSRLSQDSAISRFLKICQQRLNHMLPLGAYLLKPVQRVLRYSLLLGQIVKRMSVEDDGFTETSSALDKMTSVSRHINEMKKRYDAVIHVQELQSLIRGSEDIDLTKFGDLVLEENLRYSSRATGPTIRSRAERHVHVFLFRKLMLMTKKEDDGYQYKTHLEVKDIQLTERVEKDANCFQIRQVSTGSFFTLQAPSLKSKEKWVKNIKMLLMESIPGLPDKAKMLIMAGFPTDFGDVARRSPRSSHRQKHKLDYGDVARGSPKSPHRQSHKLDEVSVMSEKLPNRNGSRQTKTSTNLSRQSKAKPRNRSNTSPNMLTQKLVQASLVATLQLEPFAESSLTEDTVDEEASRGGQERRWDLGKLKDETKLKEEANQTEPTKERADLIPTVTITLPPDCSYRDTSGQSASRNENTEASVLEHQVCSSYQLSEQPEFVHSQRHSSTDPPHERIAVTRAVTKADSMPNKGTHAYDEAAVSQAAEDEEPVQLTRINSVDSVHEEGFNAFSYPAKGYSGTDVSRHLKPETGSLISRDSEGELTQSATVHPTESSNPDLNQSNSSSLFTDDDESLFNVLMSKDTAYDPSSTPTSSHSTSLEARVLKTLLHNSQDSISEPDGAASIGTPQLAPPLQFAMFEDDNATPTVTPNSTRRWRMEQSRKYLHDNELLLTPTATPTMVGRFSHAAEVDYSSTPVPSGTPIMKESSKIEKSHSVVRSHSYTSQHQRRIIHHREGSRSSGNSPEDSPSTDHKEKRRASPSKVKRRSSFTKGSISVVGLISTTRNDLSLEDSCIPIMEQSMMSSPSLTYINDSGQSTPRSPKLNSPRILKISKSMETSIPNDEKQSGTSENLATPLASVAHTADSPVTRPALAIPLGGNPNEKLSFDEVLQSYDHYASATGKTTRTKSKEQKKQSRSPKVSKKKKDRKRSMTVANIDAATVLAAKEAMAAHISTPEPPRRRATSRVQQLAREYSRRIKDHHRGNLFKRFSTVVEEPPEEEEALEQEPDWLKDLRERKKSVGTRQEDEDNLSVSKPENTVSGMTLGSLSEGGIPHPMSSSLARMTPEQSSTALMEQYVDGEDCSMQLPRSHSTDFELDRIATPDPVELQRKGGLKGWVKSIVMKFGTNK